MKSFENLKALVLQHIDDCEDVRNEGPAVRAAIAAVEQEIAATEEARRYPVVRAIVDNILAEYEAEDDREHGSWPDGRLRAILDVLDHGAEPGLLRKLGIAEPAGNCPVCSLALLGSPVWSDAHGTMHHSGCLTPPVANDATDRALPSRMCGELSPWSNAGRHVAANPSPDATPGQAPHACERALGHHEQDHHAEGRGSWPCEGCQ